MSTSTPPPSPDRFAWWMRQHALIMLIGVCSTFIEPSGLLLSAMAGASYLALSRISRSDKTHHGHAITRRTLTIFRIMVAIGLISELPEPSHHAPLISTLLIASAVELCLNWWRQPTSAIQRLLEQEADSLALIAILIELIHLGDAGKALLLMGLFRPLMVAYAYWSPPPPEDMARGTTDRILSLASLFILTASMMPGIPTGTAPWIIGIAASAWLYPYARWLTTITRNSRR